MPVKKAKLSVDQLALVFTQLKRIEASGLPAFQAFQMINNSEVKLKKPLAVMQQQLNKGQPISEAGFRAGVFDDTLKTFIHAGESSGKLAEVYGLLSDYYVSRSGRIKKIKSRLVVPALVLILAMFIQPLPALVTAKISSLDYMQMSLGRLFIIGFGIFFLVKLPYLASVLGAEKVWYRLQLRIPAVADWLIKRQLNQFFIILAMMLESGIAFATAFPKAVATIKNSCLREQFATSMSMLMTGASVTETLSKVPIINSTYLQIINSSEQSGKLASGILHFTRLEADTIALHDGALAEWLPRMAYVLIAIWMGYSVLSDTVSNLTYIHDL